MTNNNITFCLDELVIRPEKPNEREEIRQLVKDSFGKGTDYSDGIAEARLVEEIRSGAYYIPELALVAEFRKKITGFFMISRFPLGGKHDDEFLMLTPVAVHWQYLRKGIGKNMLEAGIQKAKQMGYKGILVEGNPEFYHKVGFISASNFGIFPLPQFAPPAPECLMAMELYDGALKDINGLVDYGIYPSLNTLDE